MLEHALRRVLFLLRSQSFFGGLVIKFSTAFVRLRFNQPINPQTDDVLKGSI